MNLLEALRRTIPMSRALVPMTPETTLDEAWSAVEKVLPKGGDYRTLVLSVAKCKPEGCGQDYHAGIEGPNGEIWDKSAGTGNATPTAALLALRDRLQDQP